MGLQGGCRKGGNGKRGESGGASQSLIFRKSPAKHVRIVRGPDRVFR